jgi:hypothetical protein
MVDMELLQEKLIRGAAVGAGSFVSGYVGDQITEFSNDIGDTGLAVTKVGLGVGATIVASDDDMLMDLGASDDSMQSEAVEFVGYGLQGAGWKELGENLDLGFGDESGGGRGQSASSKRVRRRSQKRRKSTRTDGGASSSANARQRNNKEDNLLVDA